jgi:thiol-disulfide isomerase/thioredoxin
MSRRSWVGALVALVAVQVALLVLYKRVELGRVRSDLPPAVERRDEPGADLVVERQDRSRITLPARSDQYQLVHFWATWCPPCVKEIPSLLRLARRDPPLLRVWAVSADTGWANVNRFFDGAIPEPVVRDPTGDAARAYSVRQLPDSYLVDPGGRVIARFASRQEWDGSAMHATLSRLTGASVATP